MLVDRGNFFFLPKVSQIHVKTPYLKIMVLHEISSIVSLVIVQSAPSRGLPQCTGMMSALHSSVLATLVLGNAGCRGQTAADWGLWPLVTPILGDTLSPACRIQLEPSRI